MKLVKFLSGTLTLEFSFPEKRVLKQNQPCDGSLYIIQSGIFEVKTKKWTNEGKAKFKVARKLGAGEMFGELSIVLGTERTASV